jgi:hypothetical protein
MRVKITMIVVTAMAAHLGGCETQKQGSFGANYTQESKIRVISATYGLQISEGTVTAHIASECDGRSMCHYLIDKRTIGDTSPSQAKDYRVIYNCGGTNQKEVFVLREASGQVATLSCP